MNHLDNLKEIANRQLGGLKATSKGWGEVQLKAAERRTWGARLTLRPVLAVCMALLLCVGAVNWTMDSVMPGDPVPSPSVLDTQAAGGGDAQVVSAQPEGQGLSQEDVPPGKVSIGTAMEVPANSSIFEEATSGNFPMILLDGAAYRMLKTPAEVNSGLLGEYLGEIGEYTIEPALASGGIVSNSARQGEAVYAITGMKGAMVAVNVGGNMRAFQRVSFAGSAIIGNESIADTLCRPEDVLWMELNDVGAVDDAEAARSLMAKLIENASYQSASVSSGGSKTLLIGLKNGLTMQLMASGDSISACGTWSCPEFFEAFTIAMEQ